MSTTTKPKNNNALTKIMRFKQLLNLNNHKKWKGSNEILTELNESPHSSVAVSNLSKSMNNINLVEQRVWKASEASNKLSTNESNTKKSNTPYGDWCAYR